MTKSTCAILLLVLIAGCKGKGNTSPTAVPKARPTSSVTQSASPTPTFPLPQTTASPSSRNPVEEQEYWTTTAVYESCTVYAGATDYYFKSQDGEMLKFRNSNLPQEEKAVKVSVDLVDPGPGEGPPGANPAWVGRTFLMTLNEKDEVVAAEPLDNEESMGESSPENAKKALEAAKTAESTPDLPVVLVIPEGFTSSASGGHEGTAVIVDGAGGQVHIFIPNPEISSTGKDSVVGENGLLASNGWTSKETGRQSQPPMAWATDIFPFFGADGLEGVVWLGNFSGKEVRVTASAPEDRIDEFYKVVGPMVQSMQLRK
jgi:hypothetical protein